MRLRYKPWARPELAACPFYITDPPGYIGKWNELFERKQEIHLELGCGKGGFISRLASANPAINYIAVDIKSEVLVLAKRKIEQEYEKAGLEINNIKLMSHDIERIDIMLNNDDVVSRIYINFCNPWPKTPYKKKRLTHSKQLEKYKQFLAGNGEVWFKTDDDTLFDESLQYFEESGFKPEYITYDLHNSAFEQNVSTEYERMFSEQGIRIKFLIARKIPERILSQI